MDKLEKVLSGMIAGEKAICNSIREINHLQNQMNQSLNRSSDWFYRKDSQINKINSEFDMIRKNIK